MKKGSASIGKDWVWANICCGDEHQRQAALPEQRRPGGDDQGVTDRDHQDHQNAEDDDEDDAHVGISSGLGLGSASGPSSATRTLIDAVASTRSAQAAAIAQ